MKIKSIALIILSTFIFSGCFGNDTQPIEDVDSTFYQTDEFSIRPPLDWEIIESHKFPSNTPEELIVAFQSNIRNTKFTNTVSIHKVFFGEETTISSDDFYKNSLRRIENSLVNFEEISIEDAEIIKGENFTPGVLVVYKGKQRSYENIIKFRELYVTDNSAGYIVTAAYLQEEDESIEKSIEEMINSFRLK